MECECNQLDTSQLHNPFNYVGEDIRTNQKDDTTIGKKKAITFVNHVILKSQTLACTSNGSCNTHDTEVVS